MGIDTKGVKAEKEEKAMANKAHANVLRSVEKQGDTTHQTQQENATERKITHVQYVQNDTITKYINETKNTMYFAAYPMKITSYKMAI